METRTFVAPLVLATALAAQDPTAPPIAANDTFARVGRRLDDWIERFRLSGFVAARAFDTERDGTRPDGAIGIQSARLFVDVAVQDVASAFLELRFDDFDSAGEDAAGIGEAFVRVPYLLRSGGADGLDLRVGRFDLPFGEYFRQEDADRNRLVGFPAAIPLGVDEGITAATTVAGLGVEAALTDGTWSRNSATGIGPALTVKLHSDPKAPFYASLSGIHIHEADVSALSFGGSQITPVSGSITGTSPSAAVRSTLGSFDVVWQIGETLRLQTSVGGGQVDDESDVFDRALMWFMIEPSWTFATDWALTMRASGAGTFDDEDGFRFAGRPYANASSYGFELASLQRLQLGLSHTLGRGLVVKAEIGWDRLTAIEPSFQPDDTRLFTAAELVFSF